MTSVAVVLNALVVYNFYKCTNRDRKVFILCILWSAVAALADFRSGIPNSEISQKRELTEKNGCHFWNQHPSFTIETVFTFR